MNKKGQNTILWVIVLVAIGIWAYQAGILSGIMPKQQITTTPYISTGATTLSFVTVDAQQPGTTVGATPYISVNNAVYRTGITSASPGNRLKILFVNNTEYHNAFLDNYVVPNAPSDVIQAKLNKNASVSINMYDINNVNLGTSNYTINAGQTATINVRMTGTAQASTQDMLCVLESTKAVKRISLSGFGATDLGSSKPKFYTLSGVNSVVQIYKINPLTSGEIVQGTIVVEPEANGDLSGGKLYMKCYTYEYFIEPTTGEVKYDVQDSYGTLKSIAQYSSTVTFE